MQFRSISIAAVTIGLMTIASVQAAPAAETPEALLKTLKTSKNDGERTRAAREFGTQHAHTKLSQSVTRKLTNIAEKDKDERVRGAACFSLGRLESDDPRIKEVLIRIATKDRVERVRQAAVRALGDVGKRETSVAAYTRTAQTLGSMLTRSPSWKIREDAAESLADMGKKAAPALADLQKGVHDKNERVCKASVRAMGMLDASKKATTLPELIKALDDPALRTRAMTGITHLGVGGLPALSKLIPYVNDPQYTVLAATAIGAMGPAAHKAVPALTKAVQREDIGGATSALALSKLGPEAKTAIPLIVPLLSNKDDRIRTKAAEALGNFGRDSALALPILERLAASTSKESSASKRAAEQAIKLITK